MQKIIYKLQAKYISISNFCIRVCLLFVPGGPRKSVHFFLNGYHFCYIITTETCNTGMERKFCGLFGNIFKNCEKYFYEAVFAFFCQVAEMANKPIY